MHWQNSKTVVLLQCTMPPFDVSLLVRVSCTLMTITSTTFSLALAGALTVITEYILTY